jgi:hypothetical protein
MTGTGGGGGRQRQAVADARPGDDATGAGASDDATGAGTADGGEDAGLDVALDVLASGSRRRLLLDLSHRERLDVGDRIDVIADGSGVDADLRQTLYHVHLPKLSRLGYVRWDRTEEVVTRGPAFESIVPLLDLLSANRENLPGEWP